MVWEESAQRSNTHFSLCAWFCVGGEGVSGPSRLQLYCMVELQLGGSMRGGLGGGTLRMEEEKQTSKAK